MYRSISIFIFFSLSIVSYKSFAIDPRLDWKTLETENFYIHFSTGFKSLAEASAIYAERAHKKISPALNWRPAEKTHLVLSDQSDEANGYATPLPFNRSVIYIAMPDEANSLEDTRNWLETLITHEYTHIIQLDKSTGLPRLGRYFFGRSYYLFPNVFQPPWITEGLATYLETDKGKGIGRGQSSLFRMMMRMEVEAGIKSLDQINLPLRSWPLGTSRYLYGVYFYQFIEDKYAEKTIEKWVDNYSDNLIPFFINYNAESVFNKNLKELWKEFEIWLKKDFEKELLALNKNLIAGKKITKDGYFRSQVRPAENGHYFYIRSDAFRHSALIESDSDNNILAITDINPGARIDVNKNQDVLISQIEECDEYNRYFDLFVIKSVEKKLERLTHCGRYISAAWINDGENIIAVKLVNAKHVLQLLNNKAELLDTLWQGENNEILGQPDFSSSKNKIVSSVFRHDKGWNIEEYDLVSGEWQAITQDWHIDMYAQYVDDGNSVVFSSDRDNIFNIYQWNRSNKTIQQLTKVKGGAFKPVVDKNNNILFYESYSSQGYDISVLNLPIKHFESSGSVAFEFIDDIESLDKNPPNLSLTVSDYSALKSIYPRWWLPVIRSDGVQSEFGIQTSASDALESHNYVLSILKNVINIDGYSRNSLTGSINYSYAKRFVLSWQRSELLFADENNKVSGSVVLDDYSSSFVFTWPGVESSWQLLAGSKTTRVSTGLNVENIEPIGKQDNLLGVSLRYKNAKTYIRSISEVDGGRYNLTIESNDIIDSVFSGEVYSLDFRHYFRMGLQNVLAMRVVVGWGNDNPRKFYLGGEGRNLDPLSIINPVFSSGVGLGRRGFPLRGYNVQESLVGRRMQLLSAEWRMPLGGLVERGFMAPPVGLIQSSARFFIDSGAAWDNGLQTGQYFTSVGAELISEINWFYASNLNWRLGYAKGLHEDLGDEKIYLSLGGSF